MRACTSRQLAGVTVYAEPRPVSRCRSVPVFRAPIARTGDDQQGVTTARSAVHWAAADCEAQQQRIDGSGRAGRACPPGDRASRNSPTSGSAPAAAARMSPIGGAGQSGTGHLLPTRVGPATGDHTVGTTGTTCDGHRPRSSESVQQAGGRNHEPPISRASLGVQVSSPGKSTVESGQPTSILGGSPSSCRMGMTTSCGTPPAGVGSEPRSGRAVVEHHCSDDPDAFRPDVVHVGLVLGAPGRAQRAWRRRHAGCPTTTGPGPDITHTVHTAPRKGAACGAGLSGRSPDKFLSRMDLRGPSIAPDELCIGYYDQRLIAPGAVTRQCSETTPDASLRRHPLRRRA
jgi:hypothetical protein